MPRRKRAQRVNEHECRACGERFYAVRFDAKYCGPACRQAVTRLRRDLEHAQVVRLVTTARDVVTCSKCNVTRSGGEMPCFTCGAPART